MPVGLDGRRLTDDGGWSATPKSPEWIHDAVEMGKADGLDPNWWQDYSGFTSEEKKAYEAWLKERAGNG